MIRVIGPLVRVRRPDLEEYQVRVRLDGADALRQERRGLPTAGVVELWWDANGDRPGWCVRIPAGVFGHTSDRDIPVRGRKNSIHRTLSANLREALRGEL